MSLQCVKHPQADDPNQPAFFNKVMFQWPAESNGMQCAPKTCQQNPPDAIASAAYGVRAEGAACTSDADCNGNTCASDGLCVCGNGQSGGDCSHATCLGTTTYSTSTGTFSSGVRALEADHLYPTFSDCTFVITTAVATPQYGRAASRPSSRP